METTSARHNVPPFADFATMPAHIIAPLHRTSHGRARHHLDMGRTDAANWWDSVWVRVEIAIEDRLAAANA